MAIMGCGRWPSMRRDFSSPSSHLAVLSPAQSHPDMSASQNTCPACCRSFLDSRALNTHMRFCKKLSDLGSTPKRDRRNNELSRAQKRIRYDNQSTVADHSEPADNTPGPLEVPPVSPPHGSFSFSGRRRKVPRALNDYIPHSLAGLASHLHPVLPRSNPMPSPSPSDSVVLETEPEANMIFTTDIDMFGLYREYCKKPVIYPIDDDTYQSSFDDESHKSHVSPESGSDLFHPFLNPTAFRIVKWFYSRQSTGSISDVDRLIREVVSAEDFNMDDFRSFNGHREMARLDEYASMGAPFSADDGWKEGTVTIHLPNEKSKHASETAAPVFDVSGIHYRPFLEVIKGALQGDTTAQKCHFIPFKLFWETPQGRTRVYTDIYNSDAMLEEDAKIRGLPRDPDDDPNIELAIASILLWSDSTHLASFGTASLWPIYLFLGNQSKYVRGRPNAFAAQHLAYIPTVSLPVVP